MSPPIASSPTHVSKHAVRRAFATARPSENSLALYREVAKRLAEHLAPIRIDPERILDVGTGPGTWLDVLRNEYPQAELLASDLLPARLSGLTAAHRRWRRWRRTPKTHPVAMDAENLAVRAQSVDLLTTNAMIHWLSSLPNFFASARQVLRPGGLLLLSTLGPQTLHELRDAWACHDPRNAHVHPLPDMHDIGDQLVRAGFTDVVMDSERITLTYRDPQALLLELRTLEVTNLAAARPRALTTASQIETVCRTYAEMAPAGLAEPGRVRATLELVFAHAWVGNPSPASGKQPPGSVHVQAPIPPRSSE